MKYLGGLILVLPRYCADLSRHCSEGMLHQDLSLAEEIFSFGFHQKKTWGVNVVNSVTTEQGVAEEP